jgi:hypothetical protein
MNNQKKTGSSLFLTELVIAILFFAVAATVCLQIIVRSHILTRDSKELNTAVSACSSISELVSGAGSFEDACRLIQEVFPTAEEEPEETSFTLYYDKNGQMTDSGECENIQDIKLSHDENFIYCSQKFTDSSKDEIIYELETVHHIKRRAVG